MTGDSWKIGAVQEREKTRRVQKELAHLWQGVAPGSDGQTHRIFDRAQDWHARGRYFWTSGVARERSPDAGVESGMVTASRVSGVEAATVRYARVRACSDSGSSLGAAEAGDLVVYYSLSPACDQVMPRSREQWTSGPPRRLCAPGRLKLRLCCAECALFSPYSRAASNNAAWPCASVGKRESER